MPFLFQYLIKFSLSLAVLYTFYFVVLRPLTFYQWNRFYLLGYALLLFIIPFINISDWLTLESMDESILLNSIPAVNRLTSQSLGTNLGIKNFLHSLLSWNNVGLLFISGALIMLARIIYQYLSLRAMKRRAILLKTGDFEFYDVNGPISPFSFANAIFINTRLHTEEEFHRILEHEFVHVKQKHTVDIVIAELICIFNWFNPFAWLLRKAIRQNLEFIADKNVLEGGIDARRYQYLLLKVMGLPQYSITNNFSFSSLKNRIAMMNKMKTAKVHLVKFLFVLPLLTVMLLAFRDRINKDPATYPGESISEINNALLGKYGFNAPMIHVINYPGKNSDTVPRIPVSTAPPKAVIQTLIADPVPPVADTPVPAKMVLEIKVKAAPVTVAGLTYSPDDILNKKIMVVNVSPTMRTGVDTNPVQSINILRNSSRSMDPLYIVDGKKQQASDIKNLDPNSISSINVVKDASASALYGDEAKEGVIIIHTKRKPLSDDSVSITAAKISIDRIDEVKGIIIINGKESSKEQFAGIDPASIQSISILKNSSATSVYGEKGKDGVIVITLKK